MHSLAFYTIPWIVWYRWKWSYQTGENFRRRIADERKENQSTDPPAKVQKALTVTRRDYRGHTVWDVSPKSLDAGPIKARMLYIHGGSLVFAINHVHWDLIAKLVERLHISISVALYPLGPENKLTDMYDMLTPLYDEMAADCERDSLPFIIMGDSSGATLCLVLTQQAVKNQRRVASRMVLIAPAMDSSCANPIMEEMGKGVDPWMDVPGVKAVVDLVCPELDYADPLISPLYGSDENLPPMLMMGGSRDLLAPDGKIFAERAKAKGCDATWIGGEGHLHIYPLLPFPEGEQALQQIVEWVEKGM